MLTTDYLARKFEQGMPYGAYVETAKAAHREHWDRAYGAASLTDAQRALIGSFTREVRALVTSGTWCGDCSAQCPMLARIAEANPARVLVRFLDRDEHADLSDRIKINEGLRVPTAVFMAEDCSFVHLLGDRTLTRYRAVASRQLGPSCPLPGAPVPPEEVAATLQDWVDEFERVHLLLRLSPRLREKYGD